jgi:hypothetical protein
MDPIYAFLRDLCQPAIFSILILATALLYPKFFYASYFRRTLTYLLIPLCSAITFTSQYEYSHNISAYIVGMGAVWIAILSFPMLIVHNPPEEFMRIRRREVQDGEGGVYGWESYPQEASVVRKVAWIGDLILNFRAVGWSHRVPRYPLPEEVRKLYHDVGVATKGASTDGVRGDKVGVLGGYGVWFLQSYLLVDLIICIIDPDPFFSGIVAPSMLPFPSFLGQLGAPIAPYRIFIAMIGIYAVLDLLFVSLAIVWGLLGPQLVGTWSEVWMNPPLWGPLSGIWHKGLKGNNPRSSIQTCSDRAFM